MLNQVSIVGRLTRDPELIYTPGGTAISTFCLASQRNFKNGKGTYDVDFIDCIQFNKAAENTANLARKGNLCSASGRLQKRSYEGKDGKKKYITEVIVDYLSILESKKSISSRLDEDGHYSPSEKKKTPKADEYKEYDLEIGDEDLPF